MDVTKQSARSGRLPQWGETERPQAAPAEAGFLFDPWPGSDTLFFGLASFDPRGRVPAFNWQRQFEPFPVNRLYLRDFPQSLLQRGVPGVSHDIDSTVDWIRGLMAAHGLQRLVCVGACGSGYEALLLGHLLGADEVHAFSPNTILPTRTWREMLKFMQTARGRAVTRLNLRLRLDPRIDRKYYDLVPLLATGTGKTRHHIHYGPPSAYDARLALRLAGLPGVIYHEYDSDVHPVTHYLSKGGELAGILAAANERVTGLSEPTITAADASH